MFTSLFEFEQKLISISTTISYHSCYFCLYSPDAFELVSSLILVAHPGLYITYQYYFLFSFISTNQLWFTLNERQSWLDALLQSLAFSCQWLVPHWPLSRCDCLACFQAHRGLRGLYWRYQEDVHEDRRPPFKCSLMAMLFLQKAGAISFPLSHRSGSTKLTNWQELWTAELMAMFSQ